MKRLLTSLALDKRILWLIERIVFGGRWAESGWITFKD